jgi:hypothetical protein
VDFLKKLSLIIFIVILSTNSFALINEDTIIDKIAKSINEHPEQWIDTGSQFVHCEDADKMKRLKDMSWPRHESNLVFTYNFYTTFNYIILKKPFEYDFKGEKLKSIIQAIKLYKINKLMSEVGHLLKKKREPVPEQITPQEKKPMKKDGKKL